MKEIVNKLEQIESLVHDLYWSRMGLITKERVSMVSAAISEAIETLIAIEAAEKNRASLQKGF